MNTEDYMLRISSATPLQLVVINYELIIASLRDALDAYGAGEAIAKTDRKTFQRHLDKAKNGLTQLINALNFEITIAQDLYQIYVYTNKLLNTAYFSFERTCVTEVLGIFETLLTGWNEIEKNEIEVKPVMEDAPQVYAGLTYRKDGLSEYVKEDNQRGFKA